MKKVLQLGEQSAILVTVDPTPHFHMDDFGSRSQAQICRRHAALMYFIHLSTHAYIQYVRTYIDAYILTYYTHMQYTYMNT